MGPRLGRVEYDLAVTRQRGRDRASMGPRLGRVEYAQRGRNHSQVVGLQWGHA